MEIQKQLGKPLTPTELGKLLGISASTVRRNYRRFGGVEVAAGTYRFFENKVMELIDANIRQTLEDTSLEGSRTSSRSSARTKVPRRYTEELPRRSAMGGRSEETAQESTEPNRHGL